MQHSRTLAGSAVLVGLTALAPAACGSDESSGGNGAAPLGTGGVLATGGTATGGVAGASSSGNAPSGGRAGFGGSFISGGSSSPAGTGGALSGSGGFGTGGVATGSGGKTSPGMGGATGGFATGGAPAAGNPGAAGMPSAGAGGASTPPSGEPIASPGCSAAPTTSSCNTQNAPCTLNVDGTERRFWVQLPEGYDPKTPYPVVFQYHPLGGNGFQGLTMYQVRPKLPDAIYVSPDGLQRGQYQGFSNTDGEDEALTRAMMAELEAKYCIDKGRYFATGFSFGGSMSFTAACNMSDVFRAVGVMAGAPISGAKCTSQKPARPVAVWATHGDMDTALPITMAEPIIEALVEYNGCTTETKPVEPSPCVEYQGCTAGYPVVWCPRPGDTHAIPAFGAAAIAEFFQQF